MKKKVSMPLFIFLLALILGGAIIPSRFSVTLTPSLRHRIFYLDQSPDKKTIKKSDYVMFVLTDRRINDGKSSNTIKEVGCGEGDLLMVQGKDYYCSANEYLGRAKDYSLKGERVDNFVYNGIVPEGKVFVIGHHKDSYDSRYFGFINKQAIKAKAYPVF